MLKIMGVSKLVPVKIITDMYVPIKVKFGEWDISKENTIYWRTGDFKNSLIEIGIASQSGILRSITLTQARNVFFDSEVKCDQTIQNSGIPRFCTDDWASNGIRDEKLKFEVHLSASKMSVILSNTNVKSEIDCNRVYFGIDQDNHLCMFEIFNLTLDEFEQLQRAFQ
jgi:hypothetical protein